MGAEREVFLTVGYNFMNDFVIPGWRTCSRDYSRQYQACGFVMPSTYSDAEETRS
jgi:hypothetical protein